MCDLLVVWLCVVCVCSSLVVFGLGRVGVVVACWRVVVRCGLYCVVVLCCLFVVVVFVTVVCWFVLCWYGLVYVHVYVLCVVVLLCVFGCVGCGLNGLVCVFCFVVLV